MKSYLSSFVALLLLVLPTSLLARTNDEGIEYLRKVRADPNVFERTSGLMYRILKKGRGMHHPGPQTSCLCHYAGTLIDGTTFDSSYDRGAPASFAPHQVIAGWTEAMQLMVEGDKWELIIPSELAYGDRGSPPKIGAGQVLVFQMELLEIQGDHVIDKLTCDADTLEGCNEKEKEFIDKLDFWTLHRKKFEAARLRDIIARNKEHKRFSDDMIDWMRRRIYILKQRVTYQEEETEPEL